jgi:hypothetical protein
MNPAFQSPTPARRNDPIQTSRSSAPGARGFSLRSTGESEDSPIPGKQPAGGRSPWNSNGIAMPGFTREGRISFFLQPRRGETSQSFSLSSSRPKEVAWIVRLTQVK